MGSQRNQASFRTAWISILVTLLLIGAKIIGGMLSGSLALISLAAESAIDLIGVILTLIAVTITAKPADDDHPYGHGKFDNLSALFQSLLLLGIGGWILITAVDRLLHPTAVKLSVDLVTFAILGGSFFLDLWRSQKLEEVGKQENLQSLQTDALHFFADSLSVAVVFVGLIFSKYLGLDGADSYAAILVAGFVGVLSIRQGKAALDGLTDRFSKDSDVSEIASTIKETKGVHQLEKLRMRHSGPDLFIDASISFNRVLPFASVEHIIAEIREAIIEKYPSAEVNLHPRAVKMEHESTFETLKLITSELGVLPHNIELSRNDADEITVDLHLEFAPNSSFLEAHELSEEIEAHIKHQIPSISKIVLHLEEERPDYQLTHVHDITSQNQNFINSVIALAKNQRSDVMDVREIILVEAEPYKEKKLAFTIGLDKTHTLSEAHAIVTEIEQKIRKQFPELSRIVIHSEPE
ncbi:MAG: cation diffusion facilitator family transporter [bacterium]